MRRISLTFIATLLTGAAAPALAQSGTATAPPPAPTATPAAPAGATANLIRLLVQQKLITPEAGNALLQQSIAEAQNAQATHAALAQTQAELQSARAQLAAQSSAPEGTVRVPYVPQVVKDQIRDELKGEVLAQAKTEGWVARDRLPDWVDRIRISGDLRFRDQSDFYSKSNDPGYVNYATFNANGPTEVNAVINPASLPILDTQRDRANRLSIRARLAVDATLSDAVSAGFRLASGNDPSPISTTQLLGGGFGKKDIWLDRAFVKLAPAAWASATLGRMPNPFRSTDLLYDEDLNFDGVALTFRTPPQNNRRWTVYATGGAFPFGYSSSDFPTFSQTGKNKTRDKWIFGGQVGASAEVTKTLNAHAAAAYYDISHAQGQRSQPCFLESGDPQCSSDETRPTFLSKGNTLFYLRDIGSVTPGSVFSEPQYVGLLFKYRLLDVNADVTANLGEHWALTLGGDYVRNLAFRRRDLCGKPVVTNTGFAPDGVSTDPCGTGTARAPFTGDRTAWMARVVLGTPDLLKAREWSVGAAYKRIGSDSMLDSLTDSDFHLGGTNAKGYVLTGNYILFDNVRLTARYLSANEIAGPPLGIDVLQFDLTLGF